jgi:hypothetical protein
MEKNLNPFLINKYLKYVVFSYLDGSTLLHKVALLNKQIR